MNENIKLKLLAGLPLDIDGICKLYPITLKEVAEVGYDVYNNYISNLIADIDDFLLPDDIDIKDLSTWDIIISNFLFGNNEKYKKNIINAFSFFLKEDVSFDTNMVFIINNDNSRFINRDIFDKIRHYLRIQNCFQEKDKNMGYNIDSKNDKALKLLQRMKEEEEKLTKAKSEDGNNLTLSDLISILASNSSLDIVKIFELDIYRFNNQFNRMSILDEYKVSIQYILAGADPQKINVKHYMSKI